MMKERIKLSEFLMLVKYPDGYTIFDHSTGIPLIVIDAPYERLKRHPEFAEHFIEQLESVKKKRPFVTTASDETIASIVEDVNYVLAEAAAEKMLNDVFEVEKFKRLGKENDLVFQALVFLGNSSHYLSLATTVLVRDEEVPVELKGVLKDVQQQVQVFQERLREFSKNPSKGN